MTEVLERLISAEGTPKVPEGTPKVPQGNLLADLVKDLKLWCPGLVLPLSKAPLWVPANPAR